MSSCSQSTRTRSSTRSTPSGSTWASASSRARRLRSRRRARRTSTGCARASSARAETSAALELGVALLGERGHALAQVFAAERGRLEPLDLGARVAAQPLLLGNEVQRPLVALD